jgi:lipopolysaccharide transport system ATP-binding protein
MPKAIEFNNISKIYRLGQVSTGTLANDIHRWWTMNIRGKEDPYLTIGETNDRATKGESDYVWALRDIDFKVEQGDVVGIIGKNGAGKSTLLKILSKVTAPTTGTIRARGRIGSLLEVGTGFHPEMTGRENIYMNGAILGMTKAEITKKLDEIVDFSGCERFIDTPVKRYSSGMMVRLGFAVAAHLDPEILVVDEVLAVGDAEFQEKAIGKMQDVSKGDGRTVLFVSHNMTCVRNLCKNGVLLENGQIRIMGPIDRVIGDYLEDNKIDLGDIADTQTFKRLIPVERQFEILRVKRVSPYSVKGEDCIKYHITIKRNLKINSLGITTLIVNADTMDRVGMTYSNPIQWENGSTNVQEFEITITDHHLAKGRYTLDIWIIYGDIYSSINYYDAVYHTITFEISSIGDRYLDEWHSYWGNVCLPQEIVFL